MNAFHEPTRPANRSLPWESGAEDARTPNADAWSADSAGSAKRLECVRFYRRFPSGRPAVHGRNARFEPSRLSMNQPTPNPSQEGSTRSSASCPFPSWEGLGVGSWSQCAVAGPKGVLHEPKCCRHLPGRSIRGKHCRQDAGSTLTVRLLRCGDFHQHEAFDRQPDKASISFFAAAFDGG